jgi:hypothetical protein
MTDEKLHNWYPLLEMALNRGYKFPAIKLWRNVAHVGLKEAKDYMDEVFASQRLPNGYDNRYPDILPDDYHRAKAEIYRDIPDSFTPNWYRLLEFVIKHSLKLPAIKLWRTISGADLVDAKNYVESLLTHGNAHHALSYRYRYSNLTDEQMNDNRNSMLRLLDSIDNSYSPSIPNNHDYIRELENLLVLTERVKNAFLSHNDGLLVLLSEHVENIPLSHNDGVIDAIDALKKQIDFYINTK